MTNDSVNLENFAFWLNKHLVNNILCAKFGIFVATAATSFKPEEFSIENATMRNIKTFQGKDDHYYQYLSCLLPLDNH